MKKLIILSTKNRICKIFFHKNLPKPLYTPNNRNSYIPPVSPH